MTEHAVPESKAACPRAPPHIAECLRSMWHRLSQYSVPFDDPEWLFEPKYDGFRGLVYLAAGTCFIRSKKGTTFKRFGSLCEALPRELDVKNAILDREVLGLDKTGQPQFTDLLTGPTALAYAAFDLLWLNGRDLRYLPLTKRKTELAKLIPTARAHVFKVLSVDERGWDLFEAVQRTDFEGIVAKRKADPYGPGTVWFKVKNPRYTQAPGTQEVHAPGTKAHRRNRIVGIDSWTWSHIR